LISPNRRAARNVVPHNTPNFETVSTQFRVIGKLLKLLNPVSHAKMPTDISQATQIQANRQLFSVQ
jgi:hypothetical protein